MDIITSKWAIAIGAILVVLFILFLVGKKSVHVEISIDGTPEEVWAVLTDIDAMSNWNKVLVPIEGILSEGESVTYTFYQDDEDAATMFARVKTREENRLLNQAGGMWGVLTFDHRYILVPEGLGTRVTIHEEYRGIMVPFWNPQPVQSAYERLLWALKQQVNTVQGSTQ